MLYLCPVKPARCQHVANGFQFDRLRVTDLDEGAAGKIDTEVQAPRNQREERDCQQYCRKHHGNTPLAHEVDCQFAF